jgi:tetratricopeptide (TPR) repeat protein
MGTVECEALTNRWAAAMDAYVGSLVQQRHQNREVVATLTSLELPNLLTLLEVVQRAGDAEKTIDLAVRLYDLLQFLGKPRLVERVGQIRDAATIRLGDAWCHALFAAARARIEQQLEGREFREACEGAQRLLQRAQEAGEGTYPTADFDLALAYLLLGHVLEITGSSERSLPLLHEARQRFDVVSKEHQDSYAERMVSACLTEQGQCFLSLGRADEAMMVYEEAIRRDEARGDVRDVAVGKSQLAAVYIHQRRYEEALAAHAEARERFARLDEPGSIATLWHQTGMLYQSTGQSEAAEDAYNKSLTIWVRLDDARGQASTLGQLGNLYVVMDRPAPAATFFRHAADKYIEIGDVAKEGITRGNLALALLKLHYLDRARGEILRAIECHAQFGHASEPWKSWDVLAEIEADSGNSAAAAARAEAIYRYLAYRRDGGGEHEGPARLVLDTIVKLRAHGLGAALSFLQQLAAAPDMTSLVPLIRATEAIVAGSRDRALADVAGFDCRMAAEILLLIESLEKPP